MRAHPSGFRILLKKQKSEAHIMENAKHNLKKLSEEELKKIKEGKVQHNRLYPAKPKNSKSYRLYNPFKKICWR